MRRYGNGRRWALLMTPDDYRDAIERLGLSQVAAARLLGVDARTSRRWAIGERDVPAPAARFLQYLVATGKTGDQAMRVFEKSGS
jgi:DNA-binding transcriptional regulator YiaG